MIGNAGPVSGVDQAFWYILVISVLLLLGITVAMVYFAVRYRRSRHPVPADIRGNWKLEVLWISLPTAIALTMFYFGWASYTGLRAAPADAIEIDVIGQMYSWLFVYPNDKETENELVVPLGKPVKLNVTSSDVLHSLYIPAFRIKVDAVPGMKTYAWFLPDKKDTYFMQCTEFCGVGHADMTATVRVVDDDEYQEWLDAEHDG